MNKRNIIVLTLLIVLWLVSFVVSNNTGKKNISNDKYVYKKKSIETKDSQEIEQGDGMNSFFNRKNLELYSRRNIFEKYQPIEIKVEKKVEPVKVKKIEKQPPQPVIINTPPPQPQPMPPQISEEEKITAEINNISIQGAYKSSKNLQVFLQYGGNSYEISDEGIITVNTDSRGYDIRVVILNEGYVMFQEKSKNITIKKKIKGDQE